MPQEVRERLPEEEAVAWDRDSNRLIVVGRAFEDEEGQRALREASWVAVREEGPQIALQAAGDFVEYLFAPLNYARETVTQSSGPSDWTNSRMSGSYSLLTGVYIGYSIILTAALLVLAVPQARWAFANPEVRGVAMLLGVTVVLLALMYAGRTAYDSHIRYALPIYMIQMEFLVWLAFPGEPEEGRETSP
jgi:hypothetical protein